MTATCPVCGCEQAEGLLCHADTTRLERELGDVAAIVAELDITLSKQARIGNGGKAGKGSTHEKWPINMGAVEAADNLGNVLTTWARDVTGGGWVVRDKDNPHVPVHPVRAATFALLNNVERIRRHPAVVEMVDEIHDAIKQAWRAVDRAAERVELGQCYVETPDADGRMVTCLADISAKRGAQVATCPECGIQHDVAERRAWLLQRAADMIVSVKEASSYLGETGGIRVTEASIRGYLHRGRLAYRAPVDAKRFRLGDLLDVVMDESQRKGAA